MNLSSILAISIGTVLVTVPAMSQESAQTPTQVCSQLVAAAKANQFEKAQSLMHMPEHGMKNAAGSRSQKMQKAGFDKMHSTYFSAIKDMTCASESIAGMHAVVTASSQNEKRLIPFVQDKGDWKFDMKAYRAIYSEEKQQKKSQSM